MDPNNSVIKRLWCLFLNSVSDPSRSVYPEIRSNQHRKYFVIFLQRETTFADRKLPLLYLGPLKLETTEKEQVLSYEKGSIFPSQIFLLEVYPFTFKSYTK